MQTRFSKVFQEVKSAQQLKPPAGGPLGTARILRKYQDPVVRAVEDRISEWIFPPRNSPDAAKVMRYNSGQTFDVHYEFVSNPSDDEHKGERAATVLLFLSDVEAGGEIVFPNATVDAALAGALRIGATQGACTAKGLVVQPKQGTALFFINLFPDGAQDPSSEFRDCAVIAGERWMAAKWVAVQSYSERVDYSKCEDMNPNCEDWAKSGECKANPDYMVGEPRKPGVCRKACGACEEELGPGTGPEPLETEEA